MLLLPDNDTHDMSAICYNNMQETRGTLHTHMFCLLGTRLRHIMSLTNSFRFSCIQFDLGKTSKEGLAQGLIHSLLHKILPHKITLGENLNN